MTKHQDAQAFPLSWPAGWPRTKSRETTSPFKSRDFTTGFRHSVTFDKARRLLRDELGRLGAKSVVLSTNIPLRQDGEPYAGAAGRRIEDPGVAAFFLFKGKQMAMACDRYWDIAANMRSLGLAIEAMRQLERHGGGVMMERAFDGFAALPAPDVGQRHWSKVLGFMDEEVSLGILPQDVDAAYRRLAKDHHPDVGGDEQKMAELNIARHDAMKEIGP